ncbi:MAG: xanthine dehydrogenase small subunit [Oligoflexia bacterium]|nr:MAG: xanthine dehydrogenase small subunit [Oligoflexia bacterium]
MRTQASILFYYNDTRVEVSDHRLLMPLAEFLRREVLLSGTKIVCSEGDCGACTVLVGYPEPNGKINYQSVNSCILPVFLLNGAHVITVEGVGTRENPHPVQKSMVEHFGSQCGYCTPGFITAMAGLAEQAIEEKKSIDAKKACHALTGNLCRCTGYEGIIQAATNLKLSPEHSLRKKYLNPSRDQELSQARQKSVNIELDTISIHLPVNLTEALELKKKHPDIRLVSGATDLSVLVNKGKQAYQKVLSLQQVQELHQIQKNKETVVVGSQVTIDQIENELVDVYPEFVRLLHIFASPQIKHRATLVGNVVNASPIADTIPFLMVTEAVICVEGLSGKRKIPICDFYLGYKKLNLNPDEIVTGIEIPKLQEDQKLRLYKASQRKDLDISSVTFAGILETQDKKISNLRLAFGGVGPTVIRLNQVEKKYIGQALTKETVQRLGEEVSGSINPLSDLRASKEYRYLLVKNFIHKFFDEISGGLA